MKRKCPYCKNKINWGIQIKDWMLDYGEDWMEVAELMIICEKCGEYAGVISFTENKIESEDVYSPAIKKKIKIPVFKGNKKEILTVCLACGKKYGTKEKGVMGMWNDTCDMCGKRDTSCASAPHDFGIYSSEKIKADDKIQDMI